MRAGFVLWQNRESAARNRMTGAATYTRREMKARRGEHRKMRHGGIRAVAQRDGGFCAWKNARSAVHARIECQSRLDAREAEVAGMVVELVAKHAMVIAELLEDTAQMRRESRARERIGNGAGLPVQLGADARGCSRRIKLELHLADLARRHEGGEDGQRAKQHQCRQQPISLERRQGGHSAAGSVSVRVKKLGARRLRT